MNRRILGFLTVLIVVFTASKLQVSAQSNDNKSNDILEIISLHIPDSVIFKPAEGVEIESWKLGVYLVSDTVSFKAGLWGGSGLIKLAPDGRRSIYYDQTEIIAISFNAPSDFEAQKIKFEVDGKEMIFDIANYEWESSPVLSFKSVKFVYVENWESKQGVKDIEIYLAYKNPTTLEFTVLSAISDSEGTVVFDIPSDADGNSWSFLYGRDAVFVEMMNLQKEGKPVKIEGVRMIRVPKNETDLEITFSDERITTKGNLQIWY